MVVDQPTTRPADEGAILVLTLVLTTVLAVVALALAAYAVTGLRSSTVTDVRLEHKAAAGAAVEYIADQLATTPVASDPDPCAQLATIDVGFWPAGREATVECVVTTNDGVSSFDVTTRSGPIRIDALIETRGEAVNPDTGLHPVAIIEWTVEGDI